MKKEKRFEKSKGAIIGVILTLLFMSALQVFARVAQETISVSFNNIQIAVDGQQVQTEHEPFVFQGRTYLPVRDVAYAMGFDVTWVSATNTVHLASRANTNATQNNPQQPAQTSQISPAPMPTVPPIATTPSPQPSQSPGNVQGNRPSNTAISLDRAIEIAEADLKSRGINATYHSNSGISWERGQFVWELLFRTQGERMPFIEYHISVDNGNIVKFEWDD